MLSVTKIVLKYPFYCKFACPLTYLRSGALFGDRYKSEAIEDDRYLFSLVRYIHQNPLKAGMASKLEEYEWSSYNDYIKPNDVSLTDNNFIKCFSNNKDKAIVTIYRF